MDVVVAVVEYRQNPSGSGVYSVRGVRTVAPGEPCDYAHGFYPTEAQAKLTVEGRYAAYNIRWRRDDRSPNRLVAVATVRDSGR